MKIDATEFLINSEILQIIAEIEEFKGAWQLLGKLNPERLQALKHVATVESVGSSTRIEGSKLSDQEVEALLARIGVQTFQSRDEQEVAGYGRACEEIFNNYAAIPLTENYIKQLHKMLLKYSSKDERHRGEYKKHPNHIEAFDASGESVGVVFATTAPFDTPREMEELISWTRKAFEEESLHPLLIIGVFIVVFLAIHPFQDGNGRLSRIMTTLLLLKSGYAYVPYSSLESVVEENKKGYYLALRRTQGTLKKDRIDWNPWLLFFLRSLQQQKRRLEKKVAKEKIMQASLSRLSLRIMELIQEHGQVSMNDMIRVTGASRSTLKLQLGKLVKENYLKRHGQGRTTWYTLS